MRIKRKRIVSNAKICATTEYWRTIKDKFKLGGLEKLVRKPRSEKGYEEFRFMLSFRAYNGYRNNKLIKSNLSTN